MADHAHGDPSGPIRGWPGIMAAGLAVLTLAGLFALWPRGPLPDLTVGSFGLVNPRNRARVISAEEGPCRSTVFLQGPRCLQVRVELTEGPDRGRRTIVDLSLSPSTPDLDAGDPVILEFNPRGAPGFRYAYVDFDRRLPLVWLAVLFAVAVVAFGRLRGVAALVGLVATFLVLLRFVLPAILVGRNPLLVAVVASSAIAYLALFATHGFTQLTTAALLGTLASLALTAGLATLFVELGRFTGLSGETASVVQFGAGRIDLAGIVLGGVVIGALGALDDMTVTQAAAVWELRSAAPEMERRSLLRSGLRVGRAHVASTVNTLVLAYAGASLPLLLFFMLAGQSWGMAASGELVATEILRTLVGSVGLVAAVPLTTWLACRMAFADRAKKGGLAQPGSTD